MWTLYLNVAALLLALLYGFLQLRWYASWSDIEPPKPSGLDNFLAGKVLERKHAFTVVIAARNEAANITSAINAIRAGTLQAAVIVVDDHSTDGTAARAEAAGARVLVLPKGEEGKKAALTCGIEAATTDWIVTADADIVTQSTWLATLNDFTYPEQVAVAAPVMLSHDGSWWQRWQALDFCGMMAITAGSLEQGLFAMGNGANLAFAKTAFAAVDGYESEDGKKSASGDDMVLLGKLLKRYPERIAFAKSLDAVALTPAHSTLEGFVHQRLRWAAKTGLNHQPALTLTLGVVWLFHVGLLLGLLLTPLGVLHPYTLLVCWLVKLCVDAVLLRSATQFFGKAELLDYSYPLGSFVHTLYVAGIGLLALLPIRFSWKGRRHSA